MKSMTSTITNFIVFILMVIAIAVIAIRSINLFPKTPQGMFYYVGFILGIMLIGFILNWLVRTSRK